MKIRSIRTYILRAKLRQPLRFSQWSYSVRATTLVRVEAVGGAVGWGEAYGPPEVVKAAVDSFFAPLVLDRDFSEGESLWHLMFARSLDYGQKGVMLAAISAIDIALWDLRSREANLPLYRYLGGSEQNSIPCYATGFYFLSEDINELTRDFSAEAERYRSQGFRAMKLKVGLGVEKDLRLIEAVRDVAGDSLRVMVDANHAYDPAAAIDLGRRAESFDLTWFEEPVSPLDAAGCAMVRKALRIPIAAGECEYTRFGFESLFRAGAVDYAQPDLCACGGITEALKIATLASLHSVHVTPHVWGTAIGQSAALHFYAARIGNPATLIPEIKWIECDQSENPLRNSIVRNPLVLREGQWLLPDMPGLGLDVMEDVVEQFQDGRCHEP